MILTAPAEQSLGMLAATSRLAVLPTMQLPLADLTRLIEMRTREIRTRVDRQREARVLAGALRIFSATQAMGPLTERT